MTSSAFRDFRILQVKYENVGNYLTNLNSKSTGLFGPEKALWGGG